MENQNIAQKRKMGNWGGLILIVIGLFLFLQNLHLATVPHWVFSWEMLLIILGFIVAIKHKFRGGPWFVMMLIGGIFLAEEILPWTFNFPRYGWPLVLVIIGVYMLTKRPGRRRDWSKWSEGKWSQGKLEGKWSAGSYQGTVTGHSEDDYMSVISIFGGTERIVLTKNFQGGDVTSIFGGSEVNLTQADFSGIAVIEATAVFGGIELIVPSNWEVRLEINTILGGVEDKRPVELMTPNPDKILVIKGTCIFGGVDIKSYA
jgi:predicted membrane protein